MIKIYLKNLIFRKIIIMEIFDLINIDCINIEYKAAFSLKRLREFLVNFMLKRFYSY